MTFGSRFSLLIALLVGTLAAFLVREVVVSASAHSHGQASTIVVARSPIAFGAPLTADNLEEVPWQSASPLEGGFAKVGDLVNGGRRLALLSMQRNEPVLASRVTAPNQVADERQDKPTIARAVTLELTIVQAQKVVLAEQIGRLSLVLRQANEPDSEATQRVTVDDLGGDGSAARDKVAELEKSLSDMKAAADAQRLQSERTMAQKLSDMEARLRAPPPVPFGGPVKVAAAPVRLGPVVTVTRNGSKTESYTVSAEQ